MHCISHNRKQRESIPKKIEENLSGWVAGCDICQDVCPWNKSVPNNNTIETAPKEWIKNLSIDSLNWDNKTWEENLKGSTLKRIKPWMWKRNIKANLKNEKIKHEKFFKENCIYLCNKFLLFNIEKVNSIVPHYYFPTIKNYKRKVYQLAKMHISFCILDKYKDSLTKISYKIK